MMLRRRVLSELDRSRWVCLGEDVVRNLGWIHFRFQLLMSVISINDEIELTRHEHVPILPDFHPVVVTRHIWDEHLLVWLEQCPFMACCSSLVYYQTFKKVFVGQRLGGAYSEYKAH